MASAGNWFETKRKAYNLRTKVVLSSVATYTAKVGGASDDFIVDRVIRVDGTSGTALTITLPDGKFYGQRCLVILEIYAATSTVNVSTTSGDDATQMTAAGGYSDLVWHGSTLGWVELSNEAT
jgi:hypothetical protein